MHIHRTPISAVMTRRVCNVRISQPAADALALMQARSVSSVLVLENELVLGIITERDIVRALLHDRDLHVQRCGDLMHAPVVTVAADTRCVDAHRLMTARRIRHLAVTDEQGRIVGIASEGDVMRSFGVEYYANLKDVASVMRTDFCRLAPAETVRRALDDMLQLRQSCVVAVDGAGRPVGMLTERDVVRLGHDRARPDAVRIGDVMRSPVLTVRPRNRLHAAVKTMEFARVRRLVVVDEGGAACGLLTHHEIAHGLENDYLRYLKEIMQLQGSHASAGAQAFDEQRLYANILRSVSGTAVLASDLEYRISYATPSLKDVLGVPAEEVGGTDLRETLWRVGWYDARASLDPRTVAKGARHYVVATNCGPTEFQVCALLDAQNDPTGCLVLAQRA